MATLKQLAASKKAADAKHQLKIVEALKADTVKRTFDPVVLDLSPQSLIDTIAPALAEAESELAGIVEEMENNVTNTNGRIQAICNQEYAMAIDPIAMNTEHQSHKSTLMNRALFSAEGDIQRLRDAYDISFEKLRLKHDAVYIRVMHFKKEIALLKLVK